MFRSNGRQENHISPQVDCRAGKKHVDLVPCVRTHRGAAAVASGSSHAALCGALDYDFTD
jgi:hypothetical protein